MRPVYAVMDATIAMKYRASNKNQAIQWRDYMKSKISQRRDLNIHDATYSFGIREEFILILKELHRLRENVAGFGENFSKYFSDHCTPKMTELTNQSGTASLLTVPETQVGIQGWFDWEVPDEGSRDGAGEAVTISFNYKFSYSRPTEIAMIYPIVVHNQLLDKKYRDVPLIDKNDVVKSYSTTGRVFNQFESGQFTETQITQFGYSIPTYDEFMPQTIPLASRRVLTALFTVDEANPTQFLNLAALGQKKFNADILTYMRAEYTHLTNPGMCVLNVAFYRNEFLISPSDRAILIDADLNVTGNAPLNLRVQHHLRVGLLMDWELLRGGALSRLQDHGRAAILLLLAIDPTLKERGYLPTLIGDNFVSKTSLLIAIANARPSMRPEGPAVVCNTVQICFVEADRR